LLGYEGQKANRGIDRLDQALGLAYEETYLDCLAYQEEVDNGLEDESEAWTKAVHDRFRRLMREVIDA